MDTLTAYMMSKMNRGKELKVFDWDKAARLLRQHNATNASAGLSGDWEWTGGEILRDGEPVTDSYTYLASTWATPELDIDGVTFDCYTMQSKTANWDAGTKWPESALAILRKEK
jgi:hypothetical protein